MGGMNKPVADGNAAPGGTRGTEGTTRVPPSANETVGASDEITVGSGCDWMGRIVSAQAVESTLAGALQAAEGIDDCAARPPCPTSPSRPA